MDVKELMMFKPSQTPKRPNPADPSRSQEEVEEDAGDSYEARAKKRKLALKKAQEVHIDCFNTDNFNFVQLAYKAEEGERLAQMEEEARQAKLASSGSGNMTAQEREKIQQIVEQVHQSHLLPSHDQAFAIRELT